MSYSSRFTARQQRILEPLRPFLGAEAETLCEANDRSLWKLAYHAWQSDSPMFQRLVTGLDLAQELLAEEMSIRTAFSTPNSVASYLKLRFAGQPYESFVVLFLSGEALLQRLHSWGPFNGLGEDQAQGSNSRCALQTHETLQIGVNFGCCWIGSRTCWLHSLGSARFSSSSLSHWGH